MAEHNEFGKEGEEEAAAYLIDKGYSCLLYTSDAADE